MDRGRAIAEAERFAQNAFVAESEIISRQFQDKLAASRAQLAAKGVLGMVKETARITRVAQYHSVSVIPKDPPSRTHLRYDSAMEVEQPRFTLRARFAGTVDWLCPFCGYVNHCRVDRTSWRIRCKAKPCRRWFAHGLVLHSLGSLKHAGVNACPRPISLSLRPG